MQNRKLYSIYLWREIDPDQFSPEFVRQVFDDVVGLASLHSPRHPKFLVSENVEIETRDKHLIKARLHLPKYLNERYILHYSHFIMFLML